MTLWSSPDSASTPMWAFMPKCHWLPFFALLHLWVTLARAVLGGARCSNEGGIDHSCCFEQQAPGGQCGVDGGKATECSNWFSSSRWRKRRMVVSLGRRMAPGSGLANSQYSEVSCSASPIAGSLKPNHCCTKWMRSIVSTANAGHPPLAVVSQEANSSIKLTNSVYGTTRFISWRNTRLRVRLVTSPNPALARLICFVAIRRFSEPSGWLGFAKVP